MDGTKIEANANKYTFVWNKTVDNYDRKLDEKIKKHLCEIDHIVAEEDEIYLDDDLGERKTSLQMQAMAARRIMNIRKKRIWAAM